MSRSILSYFSSRAVVNKILHKLYFYDIIYKALCYLFTLRKEDAMITKQVIVALSSSEQDPSERSEDLINETIARRAARYASIMSDPIWASPEIADILPYPMKAVRVIAHSSLHDALLEIKERVDREKIERVFLVVHEMESSRAARCAGKIGLPVLLANMKRGVFDPKAKKWWRRSAFAFFLHEKFLTMHYAWKGWI